MIIVNVSLLLPNSLNDNYDDIYYDKIVQPSFQICIYHNLNIYFIDLQ